jgi:hypothetical protein
MTTSPAEDKSILDDSVAANFCGLFNGVNLCIDYFLDNRLSDL